MCMCMCVCVCLGGFRTVLTLKEFSVKSQLVRRCYIGRVFEW